MVIHTVFILLQLRHFLVPSPGWEWRSTVHVAWAPIQRDRDIATETDIEETHANGHRGDVHQETENMKDGSQTRLGAI